MRANRRRNTTPELRLRRLLHGRGLRYGVDRTMQLDQGRVRPDIVFPGQRLAVFVDGCFWHGCPTHRTQPRANADFWREKVEGNRARDERDSERLAAAGWQVLRFWEHEDPAVAADAVEAAVRGGPSDSPYLRANAVPIQAVGAP